jgi:hypothetical protein
MKAAVFASLALAAMAQPLAGWGTGFGAPLYGGLQTALPTAGFGNWGGYGLTNWAAPRAAAPVTTATTALYRTAAPAAIATAAPVATNWGTNWAAPRVAAPLYGAAVSAPVANWGYSAPVATNWAAPRIAAPVTTNWTAPVATNWAAPMNYGYSMPYATNWAAPRMAAPVATNWTAPVAAPVTNWGFNAGYNFAAPVARAAAPLYGGLATTNLGNWNTGFATNWAAPRVAAAPVTTTAATPLYRAAAPAATVAAAPVATNWGYGLNTGFAGNWGGLNTFAGNWGYGGVAAPLYGAGARVIG